MQRSRGRWEPRITPAPTPASRWALGGGERWSPRQAEREARALARSGALKRAHGAAGSSAWLLGPGTPAGDRSGHGGLSARRCGRQGHGRFPGQVPEPALPRCLPQGSVGGGNVRSALNDVMAARKLKPHHLKAIMRGALCHLELKHYAEAVSWCDEGLHIDAKEKKLLEVRAKADKLKRTEQRDTRKAKLKEKKEQDENAALLRAIEARSIRLVSEAAAAHEDAASEGLGEVFLDGLSSGNLCGARLSLDDQGRLSWPVLFLYPEYAQSDFVSAFHEDSRFIDHLMVMFAETPSWDSEQKYCPDNLEVYFEDEDRTELYRIPPKSTLLQVLQHPRYFVKALTPAFLVCVGDSPFCSNYLQGRKVHWVK
ncbi:tetratricopeptide repeat protein 4 isoform X2 [Cavia porcellus]|uniref:tetratricopeptide repeat protein 4 isoform X2 n=1 Tax=Cavia porcellus TaxID=10141 RepID=UPI002FE201AE